MLRQSIATCPATSARKMIMQQQLGFTVSRRDKIWSNFTHMPSHLHRSFTASLPLYISRSRVWDSPGIPRNPEMIKLRFDFCTISQARCETARGLHSDCTSYQGPFFRKVSVPWTYVTYSNHEFTLCSDETEQDDDELAMNWGNNHSWLSETLELGLYEWGLGFLDNLLGFLSPDIYLNSPQCQ